MSKMSLVKKITSLPVQLLFVFISVLIFGHLLNKGTVKFFYTFSFIFKELLGFFLPFMVFAFILSGILTFKKRAPIILLVLLSFIIASNFLVSMVSFFIGKSILPLLVSGVDVTNLVNAKILSPWFALSLPQIISPDKIILISVGLGILFCFVDFPLFDKSISKLRDLIQKILIRAFIPLLPIYVLGFLLKMSYEGSLASLFSSFGKAFILIFSIEAAYLFLMYLIAVGFDFKKTISSIKNALPSYLTAFSTMSSSATIPVTVECSTKNTGNRKLAQMATPILANVHLLGDSITVPILSLVTISLFTGVIPSVSTFFVFIFYFCLTMLAVAAIPGGGIIVMIPILKANLGFTPAMISIITALYLLQDSFGTAANVMGDGALTILVNKVLNKLGILKEQDREG